MRKQVIRLTIEQVYHDFVSCVNGLVRHASEGVLDDDGFEQAFKLVASLPLSTEEFAVAVNRLKNARQYVDDAEFGAALFELRLLHRGFSRDLSSSTCS